MKFTLAIHGGAGTRRREAMSPEAEAGYRTGLQHALMSGYRVLKEGGPALEAVTKAVMALEDDPQFNAGRGAVYTSAGTHEMDAAVMDGASRKAGAVAGVMGPRNPVLAARAVMERS
ncbi:MAG: isoaspartyl peptidase/L-asparaginase, partial [Hyphomicrobiales bacterium]|nr:isoaspartyl peptidase/L-asparaginase [Hyphomicrobiales bacterium]